MAQTRNLVLPTRSTLRKWKSKGQCTMQRHGVASSRTLGSTPLCLASLALATSALVNAQCSSVPQCSLKQSTGVCSALLSFPSAHYKHPCQCIMQQHGVASSRALGSAPLCLASVALATSTLVNAQCRVMTWPQAEHWVHSTLLSFASACYKCPCQCTMQ